MKQNIAPKNIDGIKPYCTYQRIFKHLIEPGFIKEAYKKYNAYPYPVIFTDKKGTDWLIANQDLLDVAIENGESEVEVIVADIKEDEVISAVVSFNFHKNQQHRASAEVVAVLQEQQEANGSKWLFEQTKTNDKNAQIAHLTGMSVSTVKLYKKMLLPENKSLLDRLSKEFSIYDAKEELTNDKKPKAPTKPPVEPKAEDKAPVKPKENDDHTGAPEDGENENGEPTVQQNSGPKGPVPDLTGNGLPVEEDKYDPYLNNYRKTAQQGAEQKSMSLLTGVVFLKLNDGSTLELNGDEISLKIDGIQLQSTLQLTTLGTNRWGLPEGAEFDLRVKQESDFLADL